MAGANLFHLAFPVHDLDAARAFYAGVLGCAEGRSDIAWVDFNFFGHQLVAHLTAPGAAIMAHNPVDGDDEEMYKSAAFGVSAKQCELCNRTFKVGVTSDLLHLLFQYLLVFIFANS